MARRYYFAAILSFSLLANAFTAPVPTLHRLRRATDDIETSNDIGDKAVTSLSSATPVSSVVTVTIDPFDDDDDDDFEFGGSETTSSGGGSNIFSILKIISALFPGSSSAAIMNLIMKYLVWIQTAAPFQRQFKLDNRIEIVHSDAMPQFKKLETKYESDLESPDSETQETEEDKENEESVEDNGIRDASIQDSDSNLESDQDSDYDEPPGGGDGAGGGILGLIAGLSGGEDGQSDLGSLLATFSGIIANLSGDGIDLNSLIASGIGLFVGLLSEGDENPGAVIASYLLTSLDTITGGGAKNNGAFFGNFLTKLVKGTSAGGDPDVSSEEGEENKPMSDSAGFVSSFLLSLLGDMSKSSSGGSSKPWR